MISWKAIAIATAAVCWVSGPVAAAQGCATGTTCLDVTNTGETSGGTLNNIAQCTGAFPDFISTANFLADNPEQRWFRLSQAFPTTITETAFPWKTINYQQDVQQTNAFLYALRDYALEGMVAAEFDPAQNNIRKWYHMPLMNFGPRRREPFRGVTQERPIKGPELGLKSGVEVSNYAVGFYNEVGGKTIGEVWNASPPDLAEVRFGDGTMTFKILFSAAEDADFQVPAESPLIGAPSWTIATRDGAIDVRLMQMDVAVVDPNSPTGWVFGTLAYDRNAPDLDPWLKLRPVGLSWGNDEGVTPQMVSSGTKLTESIVSDLAPPYAAKHLGWAGRVNGPIDNPRSGCLSCHGTA